MYKTRGIILYIQKIRDMYFRVILYTEEYGKITCWLKKWEFLHGLWDIIFVTIERNQGQNILKKTESIISVIQEGWQYDTLWNFLWIIKTFYIFLPEMLPVAKILEEYSILISHQHTQKIENFIYTLFQLRILKKLGHVWEDWFENSNMLLYIIRNIDTIDIEKLLWSKKIENTDIEKIEKYILHTFHTHNWH